MSDLTLETRSPEETRLLGERIAGLLEPGDVVLLHGDLGAGKTTLAQGITRGLGVEQIAQSPTFSLIVDLPLPGGATLRHIDLYRLDDIEQLDALGFEDLVGDPDAIALVEWPERAIELLPERYLLVELEPAGVERRTIRLRPMGLGSRFQALG